MRWKTSIEDHPAVLRVLHCGDADMNAAAPSSGMTALHYLACVKYGSGTDPRMVKWLLEHGTDPNVGNANSDTPLGYLAGSSGWSQQQYWVFQALVHYGTDLRGVANDGGQVVVASAGGQREEVFG